MLAGVRTLQDALTATVEITPGDRMTGLGRRTALLEKISEGSDRRTPLPWSPDNAFASVEHALGATAAVPADWPLPDHSPADCGAHRSASRKPQVQPWAVTADERAAALKLRNCAEYAGPPGQIRARELDAGRPHCCVSTMHRTLREKGYSGECRRQTDWR